MRLRPTVDGPAVAVAALRGDEATSFATAVRALPAFTMDDGCATASVAWDS